MEGHSFSPEPQFLVFSFNLPVFPFQFQVFWPILTFVFVVQIFCVCFILVYTVNLANTYFFFFFFFFFFARNAPRTVHGLSLPLCNLFSFHASFFITLS